MLPGPYIHGVASRRLWACAEHGVIYSAPDDATVYRDVTSPECEPTIATSSLAGR